MQDALTTTFRGYAPDQRGGDRPPELVYETERAPRPSWALKIWTLVCTVGTGVAIVGAALQGLGLI